MRMTTKGRYGLRAVVNLALKDDEAPVPLSRIAQEEEVSSQFLEQIFFALKKAGLVNSVRGPKGGFTLARDPADIEARDVLMAVDESLMVVPCTQDGVDGRCARKPDCPTFPMWKELSSLLNDFFANTSIASLVEGTRRPRPAKQR